VAPEPRRLLELVSGGRLEVEITDVLSAIVKQLE
jgi:hypothetical protein